MDEPTVGLDPASRSDLLKLLLTMRTERGVASCGRRICATKSRTPTA